MRKAMMMGRGEMMEMADRGGSNPIPSVEFVKTGVEIKVSLQKKIAGLEEEKAILDLKRDEILKKYGLTVDELTESPDEAISKYVTTRGIEGHGMKLAVKQSPAMQKAQEELAQFHADVNEAIRHHNTALRLEQEQEVLQRILINLLPDQVFSISYAELVFLGF